jgi:hypothetical protein
VTLEALVPQAGPALLPLTLPPQSLTSTAAAAARTAAAAAAAAAGAGGGGGVAGGGGRGAGGTLPVRFVAYRCSRLVH